MSDFTVKTEFMTLGVTVQDDAVTEIRFHDGNCRPAATAMEKRVASELQEYAAGGRQHFEFPIAPAGTPFQQKVWTQLQRIPFGETRSYGDVAKAIGKPDAYRAVGGANHHNPIPIVIPCHRVVSSDGTLAGFGGGVDLKRRLLALESSLTDATQLPLL
jgi:O-6-methylguanine DNA methyltransferase